MEFKASLGLNLSHKSSTPLKMNALEFPPQPLGKEAIMRFKLSAVRILKNIYNYIKKSRELWKIRILTPSSQSGFTFEKRFHQVWFLF